MHGYRIKAIGTANPPLYMSQREVFSFYEEHGLMPENQRPLYRKILLEGPVEGRHVGLDRPEQILEESSDDQNRRFNLQGRRMLLDACRQALDAAGFHPEEIGGVVVSTCTGYLCPGLTSYLAEDLGLANDVKTIDIMGMGCGSAIPNLETACGLLDRTRGRPVISAAVEVCSATHLIDDDPGLTVSNSIFGDGAAAVVIDRGEDGQLDLLDFESALFPEHREELRYRQEGGRLRNNLSRRVPVVGARCVQAAVERILSRNSLDRDDIKWWAVHAGGSEVLRRVAKRMEIDPARLKSSFDVFRRFGNMSSPTVLFTLKDMIAAGETLGYGLVLAFGAGFTAFAALARGGADGSV